MIKKPVVCADIDGTLVTEVPVPNMYTISFQHPYQSRMAHILPNKRNIDVLKNWSARGRFVIVWSAAGQEWAVAVLQALGLTEYSDLTLEKPIAYLDDLDSDKWMGHRVWLNDEDTGNA